MDIYQGPPSFSVWRFGLYSPNHLCYRKYVLISIKALICGYLEPKKLRARPPNKAATPSWMKLNLFHLKGHGGFIWGPSPQSLLTFILILIAKGSLPSWESDFYIKFIFLCETLWSHEKKIRNCNFWMALLCNFLLLIKAYITIYIELTI